MRKRTPKQVDPALAERLRELVGVLGTQARAAEVAGAPLRTLRSWVLGENSPPIAALATLAEAAGYELAWLARGREPKLCTDRRTIASARASTDAELLGRIVDTITRVHREERVELPPVDLGRIAAEWLDVIGAATATFEEQLVAVKTEGERLRLELRRAAAAAPAARSSKLGA